MIRQHFPEKYIFKQGDIVRTPRGIGKIWNVQYYPRTDSIAIHVIFQAKIICFYKPSDLELIDAE